VLSHRGRLGASLGNPARDLHKRLARERAAAERRRITYVALTRAKKMLVLVGTPGDAPRDSARAILDGHAESALAGKVERWDARPLLERALAAPLRPAEPVRAALPAQPRAVPVAREIALATTPLGVFRDCPRRFSLRFLRGLDEPVASGQLDLFELDPFEIGRPEPSDDPASEDPRVLGRAAHRVLERWPRERFGVAVEASVIAAELEREGLAPADTSRLAADLARFVGGQHAARLSEGAFDLFREQEVVLRLDGGDGPSLVLRGTIDAYILDRDSRLIDLFDYKLARSRPSLDAYAFQLRAYALALARRHPGTAVRAGVVFLLGGETRWLEPSGARFTAQELEEIESELLATARAFAEARATGVYAGIAEPACRALGCGFLTACHRGARSRGSR
jgi:ATP-dependent helicase/nuclease subunit A